MPDKKKIGEIFVESGTISQKTLQRALDIAKAQKKKLGYTLEDMGVITGLELAEALAHQFGYEIVSNMVDLKIAPDVLKLIPDYIAMRYLLFPVRKKGTTLYLAMTDPTDNKIVSNIAENYSLIIVPLITTRAEIVAAINKHYLGKDVNAPAKKTVLIADDDPLTCSELRNTLSREGYRVVCAKDGIEAFKMAITESPDVILTDKNMPNLGGYRLLESLKSLYETNRIPVIMLTASLNSEEEAEAFRKGFFDFMIKPVKEVTLVTRVKRAIETFEGLKRFD